MGEILGRLLLWLLKQPWFKSFIAMLAGKMIGVMFHDNADDLEFRALFKSTVNEILVAKTLEERQRASQALFHLDDPRP